MLDPDLFAAFLATTLLFAFMPGPGLLYTAAQTVARGRAAGFMAMGGLAVGGMIHVVAATLGLSTVFALVPEAYLAVKLAGAAYLVWLGLSMILARDAVQTGAPGPRKARRAFLESVTVEVLNPKTALFFLALLPQFVSPEAGLPVWAQFLVLGTLCNLMFSASDLLCVLFASRVVAGVRRSAHAARLGRWAAGTVIGGLGVKLALDRS